MALVTTQGLSATLPISEANVTNLVTDLAAKTPTSTLNVVSKDVSSAQLLALATTPVQVLPALGGRNYYVVQFVVYHYRFVTTGYANLAAGVLALGYGSTVAAVETQGITYPSTGASGAFPTTDLLAQTADAYILNPVQVGVYGAWLAADIENKPISFAFGFASGSNMTTGDGTLTLRVFYSTINGAP